MPRYVDINALSDDERGGTRVLSPFSVALLNSTLEEYLLHRRNWETDTEKLPDADWDELDALLAQTFLEINMSANIGSILPFVTTDLPNNILLCDGTQYAREDYPELYAVLDSQYIDDADNFTLPDLRDLVLVGSEDLYSLGQTGGEDAHTLIESEMPAHTHTDAGHIHTTETSTPTLIAIGAGVPAPSAIPGVGSTAAGFASLANTGGDTAHENRMPFYGVKFGIVAL